MTKPTLYAAAVSALLLQSACSASASGSGRRSNNKPAFAFLSPPRRLHQHQQHCSIIHHSVTSSSCSSSSLSSTAIDDIPSDAPIDTTGGGDPELILQARNRLLALSTTLASNSPSGKFISRPSDKVKLQKAINDLEALASSTPSDREKDMLLGDWTLIATANLPSSDIRRRFNNSKRMASKKKKRRSGLSLFGSEGQSLNPIQKSIRKAITVTQRIRNDGTSESGGGINRVDNVVEFTPLDTLEDIIPEESPLFKLLGTVNVNPLQVKKSKVILVHKAEVESVAPVLRTKIAWTSSVLNVAGTSQYFDPEGGDIFGVNNAFGEFINVGTFDTPFVDDDIRISRTSGPVLEQLRVFVRSGSSLLEDDTGMMDSLTAELRVEEEKEVTQSESGDVGTQVKKVVDAATSLAENARDTIEKDMDVVTNALGDSMDDVVGKVQDAVEGDLEQIGKAVEEVQSAMQEEKVDGIIDAIANVTKAVVKVPTDVRTIVEEDVTELSDKVEEALDTMVADVQDSVESDLKDVGKSMEDLQDAATGAAEEMEEDVTEIGDKVEEELDTVVADVQDSVESDLMDLEELFEEVRDVATPGGSDGEPVDSDGEKKEDVEEEE
mmetsp:Transcript_17482/g.31726  ORF Transcript_17482/g.31726 Transcript_17482/m.31726 type:complete len:609 (-) Transcript_17482:132-1958(-)